MHLARETLGTTVFPGADAEPDSGIRLWGLTAPRIHEAHWRSFGIAAVRRGRRETLPRDADAFLLVDADQLAGFRIERLAETLRWSRAAICRVRLFDPGEAAYRERVVVGLDGSVKKVERRYGREESASERVLLVRRRDLAERWAEAASPREGWRAIRRRVSAVHVDHLRVEGRSFRAGDRAQELGYLRWLVEAWPDPSRTIDGIEEIDHAIFARKDAPHPKRRIVGPAWIGGETGAGSDPLVGPACLPDATASDAAAVREIGEIIATDRRRRREGLPRVRLYGPVKRAIDVTVSAVGLALLSPILLAVAVAIVADDGFPLLFGHRRQGRGGSAFRCWKFRTMRRDAEAMAQRLRELNVCDGPQFFIRNDPRVTRVGRILRKLNLDEIPQLFNVLVGDMSLVGPRPSPDGENQFCPSWREIRLSVRPGITGLWQVRRTRRPGYDFQEWIRYDVEYVRRASLWLDLRIVFETFVNVAARRRGTDGEN